MIRTIKLYGTTDGSGDLTVTADVAVVGLLHSVEWIVGNFAAGVDAVLSLDLTAADADKVYHTRYLASNNVGADLDTAGDATYTKGFVSGKLKLVVSDGGDKKTGGCIVYVEA